MGLHDDDSLLRRVASLSPERRAMISALLDEPPDTASADTAPADTALADTALPEARASSRALTAAEQSLLAIWEQVLGVSGVGLHDDFFAIGGDSIAAMRVAAKAQKIGLSITVRDLVTRPTIAELLSSTAEQHRERSSSESRPIPFTPAQWHAAGSGLLHHGSMTDGFVARVPRAGTRSSADVLTTLFKRHDSLRLQLRQSPVGWELIESPRRSKHVPLVDLSALPENDARLRAARLERQLASLGSDADRPLCRALCWHTGLEAGLLLLCHRWCADEESMEILQEETARCLRAYSEGRPAMLPQPCSFGSWAIAEAGEARPDVDDSPGSARLSQLRGTIERDVALPVSWTPGEPKASPNPLEHLALAALARSLGREVRVILEANARTAPELRDAVGYYVRPMDLSLSRGPASVGLTCFFRQPLASPDALERERCRRTSRTNKTAWSRYPLEIHNEVAPGRWRTVWRFDEAIHAEEALLQRCDVFLAEIARLVAEPAAERDAVPPAFAEADLSSDELDRLLAG